MNRDEALQAVIALCIGGKTEEEDVEMANRLREKLPHSGIVDLIFQDMRNLTPEQVVEEAFKREAQHAAQSGADEPH